MDPAVGRTARPRSAMRVLIADDNRDSADSLAQVLNVEFGCSVATAYDGASALTLALADRPDVVILDIRMPGMGGIDVARELRRAVMPEDAAERPASPVPPLMLAMTGGDVTGALEDIDECFRRAFAKPVNIDDLLQVLRDHWQGEPQSPGQGVFEVSALLSRVAREAAPLMRSRAQALWFDYVGPFLVLQGNGRALHEDLSRLLLGVVEMTGPGFVVFKASSHPHPSGAWQLVVQAAVTGPPGAPLRVDRLLAGMQPKEESVRLHDAPLTARKASAVCPGSGAHVTCMSVPSEGSLVRVELACWPVEPVQAQADADADGARAWIVDHLGVPSELLARRLQRLGWRVSCFAGCRQALERAMQMVDPSVPAMVVLMESAGDDTAGLAELRAALPATVHRVLVVAAGSPVLRDRDTLMGCAVHLDPLSPGELVALTQRVHSSEAAPSSPAGPTTTSAALQDRPRVLVVDDVEVNRVVAGGMVRALGYEASSVSDGLDAVDHCKNSPPDLVLMDVSMPVLNGVEATRRIRELQRLGRVPPFPIVAATADADDETMSRCREAGMDGFIAKPLTLQALNEELGRVVRLNRWGH